MTESKVCPGCGTANTPDSRFCGRCGTPLGSVQATSAPAPPPVAAPVPVPQKPTPTPSPFAAAPGSGIIGMSVEPADSKLKTMMMRSSPADGEGSSGSHVVPPEMAKPAGRAPQRTMLGIAMGGAGVGAPTQGTGFEIDDRTERANPSQLLAQAQAQQIAQQASQHALPPSPAAAPPSEPSKQPLKTMLGMAGPWTGQPGAQPAVPSAPQPAQVALAPQAAPPSIAHAQPQQPMAPQPMASPPVAPIAQPMQAPQAPQPMQAAVAAPQPMGQAVAPPAAAPAPSSPQPAMPSMPEVAPAKAPPAKKLGPSNRTMLGVTAPAGGIAASGPAGELPAQPGPVAFASQPGLDTGELSIAGMPSPRKRNTGCLVAVLASAILVAVTALGTFGYYHFVGRGPSVTAAVAMTPQGEVVRIQVPDAAQGTVVRYGGATQPVTNGVAELPLAADALHLGDNVLNVEIVAGNTTTAVPITLTVEYRVRADLSGLEATPPTMAVLVEALPGSTVTISGAAVAIDAQGHGRVEVPVASLSAGADGALSHVAPYVVTPPSGQPASGTLSTRIPLTALELRQPLDGAVTDRAAVVVAGRAAPPASGQATHVTIEGQEAAVSADGSFRVEVPLPSADTEGRATLHVVARRAGSAPRALSVSLRRVPDLRRAASELVVDRTLGYGQLADTADAVRGRLVSLEGQVYNADVQDGRGVLQMLVRGCTRTDRCPLWVTYAPADPVEPGAVVRVVGVAGGTQQFRAESGETRTVPRIDATYVVPAP